VPDGIRSRASFFTTIKRLHPWRVNYIEVYASALARHAIVYSCPHAAELAKTARRRRQTTTTRGEGANAYMRINACCRPRESRGNGTMSMRRQARAETHVTAQQHMVGRVETWRPTPPADCFCSASKSSLPCYSQQTRRRTPLGSTRCRLLWDLASRNP